MGRGPLWCGSRRRTRHRRMRTMDAGAPGVWRNGASGRGSDGRRGSLRGGGDLSEGGCRRRRGVEQYDVLALQAHFAVRSQNKLHNRVIDRRRRADMQACLPSRSLDAQLRAQRRRNAVRAGGDAEAIRRRIGGRIEQSHRRMQGLPQLRAYVDFAHAQGCGGTGLTQTQKKTNGFEVHTVGKSLGSVPPLFRPRTPQL